MNAVFEGGSCTRDECGVQCGAACVAVCQVFFSCGGADDSVPDQEIQTIREITKAIGRFPSLYNNYSYIQCCRSGMFIPEPGSDFFHPGFRVDKISDPGSASASRNMSILT
jgi:hypothetical protein